MKLQLNLLKMTTQTTEPQIPETTTLDCEPFIEAFREITHLAQEISSKSIFLKEVVERIAIPFGSPYASIDVRLQTEVIHQSWQSDAERSDYWKPTVESFLTESLSEFESQARVFTARNTDLRIALFSDLIKNSNGFTIGAIAMVVPCPEESEDRQRYSLFKALVNTVSICAELVGQVKSDQTSKVDSPTIQTLDRLTTYSSKNELAIAITNNLRNKTGCDQIALGLVNKRYVKIMSISSLDEVRKRSPGIIKIRSAMEECVHQCIPIVYQPNASSSFESLTSNFMIHKQMHEEAGGASVASIPILSGEKCLAVLSMKRTSSEPFTEEQIVKYTGLVEPYIKSLELIDRANRGLISHSVSAFHTTIQEAITPHNWFKKAMVVSIFAFLIWFAFGSLQYEVSASCEVLPKAIRHFTAPSDAILRSAPVVAGDRVKKGDILCEFDHVQLTLEQSQLESELAITLLEENNALSDGTPIDVKFAQATQNQYKALLDIVNQKIEQSIVRAPFDGVIVNGDLRDRIGDVFIKGDPLFELSSDKEWTFEIQIPESDITELKMGMTGRFASNARPELHHPFQLTRLHPSAELREGNNVYIVEAQTDFKPAWMRSGMKGISKVEAGPRPVWWITFHKLLDYFRLTFWI